MPLSILFILLGIGLIFTVANAKNYMKTNHNPPAMPPLDECIIDTFIQGEESVESLTPTGC